MKKWLFIVSFLILAKPVLPLVDYVVNYEYISKVLCVNKAKPAMHCNGKCHLMKELAKASENEKPLSSDKKSNTQESETLFFQPLPSVTIVCIVSEPLNKVKSVYANLYAHDYSASAFHPPAILS